MFRFLTLTALLAGALLLTQGAAQGQNQDLPVAGPDEIIFVGEVPAPPGTEVRAEYLQDEPVVCGTARADENSRFVIRIDAECARGGTGPLICWAPGLEACQGFPSSPFPSDDRPDGGDTIYLGLLRPASERPPPDVDVGAPAPGDGIVNQDLPVAAADEIIFVGEVPAPPGTEITATYVPLIPSSEVVVCGSTTLDENSNFVLIIDASCADGAVGPLICWGDFGQGACASFPDDPYLVVVPRDGQTIDAGLLTPVVLQPDIGLVPHGDGVWPLEMPKAGVGEGRGRSASLPWLLLGVGLLGIGLGSAGLYKVAAFRD